MPTSKAAPPKRELLTLAQLSTYDDFLTDALVDHVYYWTTIPKNRPSYHASRGLREEDICSIIQEEIVLKNDIDTAQLRLLNTTGFRKFVNSLKTDKQRRDFQKHMRRYLQIYSNDCPWEVNSTNRYTITSHEAAVTARRPIQRNESIKYLSGIQVVITPAEEKEISVRKKDFSIVVSSRNKCTSLFMGPARFANHDCDANAKLMTTGLSGIEIIATRRIEVGEEVTVTYGDSYFGEDNCECLCVTCEADGRNGWASGDGSALAKEASEEEHSQTYSLRRRNRERSDSRTSSVTPDMRPRISKARARSSLLKRESSSTSTGSNTPRGRKRSSEMMASPPITPLKKMKYSLASPASQEKPMSRSSSSTGRQSLSSREVCQTTAAATPDDKDVAIPETLQKRQAGVDATSADDDTIATPAAGPLSPPSSQCMGSPSLGPAPKTTVEVVLPSVLESLSTDIPISIDDTAPVAESIEPCDPAIIESVPSTTAESRKPRQKGWRKQDTPPPRTRTPGDYVLTPLLLSEPEMAWIQCTKCPSYFVQQDAYFTRSSCPRCERHSKLYGYLWPKTDKHGSSDKEERILDHRTIHRFLHPIDEKKVRGLKTNDDNDNAADESADAVAKRGRPPQRQNSKSASRTPNRKAYDIAGREEDPNVRRSGRCRRVSSRLSQADL